MPEEAQPQFPLLYSVQGFRYCDLLLAQGKYQDVQDRGGQMIEISKRNNWLLDIALDHLSLGRAYLLEVQKDGTGEFSEAADHLVLSCPGGAATPTRRPHQRYFYIAS